MKSGVYRFKYSPAIIFSGDVPALDVNFFQPNDKVEVSNTIDGCAEYLSRKFSVMSKTSDDDSEFKKAKERNDYHFFQDALKRQHSNGKTIKVYYWEENGMLYAECEYDMGKGGLFNRNWKRYQYNSLKIPLDDEALVNSIESKEYSSIASGLQETIATWYSVLRRIALVGLLSVLVYMGIRIVMSSSAGDKAKYKSLMKDWLIAVCLLFTLHYIMSITVTIVNQISDVFAFGDETDHLLNTLRGDIYVEEDTLTGLAQVIMYTSLVMYTVVFTFQYLKRVIYMAFYTLVAPLITLTYPLDKVKDGQAQAFNMWIREYVYTALTQVIHLVIYSVMVGSALELVNEYPLYAIIVMFFIKKADGIIKKMFGFDKVETVGAIGNIATGALAMNLVNKLGKSGAKKSSPKEEGKNKIRTVSNGNSDKNFAQELGAKAAKTAGSAVLKTAPALAVGLLGGAVGAAQGDMGAAFKGAIAGATAGGALGGRVYDGVANGLIGGEYINSIRSKIDNVKDTWNEGAYGKEFAENASMAREFKRQDGYGQLKNKYGDNLTDDKLRTMMEAGVTNSKDMDKILGSGNMDESLGYYALAKKCPDSIYYDSDENLESYIASVAGDLGLTPSDISTMRQKMKQFR